MKNIQLKTWEWVMIAVTIFIILFSDQIVEKFREEFINDDVHSKGGGFWKKLTRGLVGAVPIFGSVLQVILDEIWP